MSEIEIEKIPSTLPEGAVPVLDKGFVRLVEHLGDDSSIVRSARVSYGKGTKTTRKDKGLIDYLVRHKHTSPLEFVVFVFHLKIPIFVHNQMVRHRMASQNVVSGRYSVMSDEFYLPDEDRFALQSDLNKQGSSTELIDNPDLYRIEMIDEQKKSYEKYEEYLGTGMARELARINLPLSLYTQLYWKIDLHNLLHFLRLRMDSHAQQEIRDVANIIYELIKPIVPYAIEAFEENILHSQSFSRKELEVMKSILHENPALLEVLTSKTQDFGWSETRRKEFLDKLL